ncbi:MAG: alpha/beta fold hydrolase [Solirubrobacteraceae bacterium]
MAEALTTQRLDLKVAGGTLAAFRFGGLRVGGPTVVAAHGITSSSRAWSAVARALSGRATLVAPDLRGRGASSELPGPFGLATHVADLLALLDDLSLDRAVLVGHSLGAYIVARLAVEHPERVSSVVLIDGGLTIPGLERANPQAFIEAFLGPALARLTLSFPDREAYRDWWRAHPAFAAGDVADSDLVAYADHDLVGEPPRLRSSVCAQAVRADAAELLEVGAAAHRLTVPANLLCAPRGLLDDPNPVIPLGLARSWAARAPAQRRATLVEGANHYTITLGARGAAAAADALAAAAGTIPSASRRSKGQIMGISDKLDGLTQKAKDAAAEHHDQILGAVQKAEAVADQRTGGKYHEQITKAGGKAQAYVARLSSKAAEADAPPGSTA